MVEENKSQTIAGFFGAVAQVTSQKLGHAASFAIALLLIVIWGAAGPIFKYSDTWQLVINTGTTIVTFLMVFLIQNTQNRDMAALHLKLDELIRANEGARDKLLNLEDMTEEELKQLKEKFKVIASHSDDSKQLEDAKQNLVEAAGEIGAAKDKIAAATARRSDN